MQATASLSTPPKDIASAFGRPPASSPSAAPENTALSNPGNMYGLMVRVLMLHLDVKRENTMRS